LAYGVVKKKEDRYIINSGQYMRFQDGKATTYNASLTPGHSIKHFFVYLPRAITFVFILNVLHHLERKDNDINKETENGVLMNGR
jgi:hypothetical protein